MMMMMRKKKKKKEEEGKSRAMNTSVKIMKKQTNKHDLSKHTKTFQKFFSLSK